MPAPYKTMQSVAALLVLIAATAGCEPNPKPVETNPPEEAIVNSTESTQKPVETSAASGRVEVNGAPDSSGALSLSARGAIIRIEKCSLVDVSPTVSRCEGDTYVDFAHEGQKHSILLTSLYIDRTATFYRGPLDQQYKQNGHSFVLTDVDGDGREDLIVWTGKEGAYGGPSYEVLLYDQQERQFNVAPMLSELTVGANGLFSIKDGRLVTSSSDGCCMRVFDTFTVTNGEPSLVERVTETRDEAGGAISTKTERMVDGQLHEVI